MKKKKVATKSYFNSTRYIIFGIITLFIGLLFLGSSILSTNQKKKADSFKTVSYDEEATASGQIEGVFDETKTATPSPSITVYYQPYITQNKIITPQIKSPTATKIATNNNPTSTPVPATNNTIQNTSTPAPTAQPTQPAAPTPTSKPSFGASINTSIDGDTLKVTVEANSPLKVCVIHYLKDVSGADVPAETKNVSPNGNTCSTEGNKADIKKIKAYIASTEGATAEVEKSGLFE